MSDPIERRIARDLAGELSPRRWRHTQSVAHWAAALARIHGLDAQKAYLAGLLHDCAKEFSGAKLKAIYRRKKLSAPGWAAIRESRRWGLLHATVSAWRAKKQWGIADRQILSAVARHTLGARRMSSLDQVIYVADFSSPDRRYAEARKIRRVARRDLRAALRETVRHKIKDVLSRAGTLNPATVELWNELCKIK